MAFPNRLGGRAASAARAGHRLRRERAVAGLADDDIQVPAFAPTIAIEILSPDDDPRDVASKVVVYLRAGSALVIVVDPKARTMTVHEPPLSSNDVFFQRHAAPRRANGF